MISKVIAKFITLILPKEMWYRAAFIITKYYAYIFEPPEKRSKKGYHNVQSAKLETLLLSIGSSKTPPYVFPISLRVQGKELLKDSYPNGLLLCTIHIPLVLVAVRHMIERGVPPDAIIVHNAFPGDYLPIVGTTVRIPVLVADPAVLIKVRGILRKGGIVIVLIDDLTNGGYSPNIFRLAEKLDSNLLFSLTKLQPDGYIQAYLFELPTVASAEEDSIKLKIDALHEHVITLMNQD